MRNLPRLSLEHKLLLVFVIGALVLLGTILYSMRLAQHSAQADALRDATSVRLRLLNLTLSALQDSETGQRGFVITGQPAYLEPFELALGEIERRFGELRRLYRGQPEGLARIARMQRLKDAKLAELRRTIELRRHDGPQAAIAAVLQGEGKAQMDEFRREMRQLLDIERERYAEWSRLAERRRLQSQFAYAVVFAGTVIASIAAYLLLMRELHERRRLRERLQHDASHHPLTRLPNGRFFQDWLRHSVAQARREKARLGLLFVNLDGFARLNERFGRRVGDQVLQLVAERFGASVRDSDFLAHIGGDEFAVVTPLSSMLPDTALLASRMIAVLDAPLLPQLREHPVSASIGIASYPEDADEAGGLVRAADTAMREAKREGRHRHRHFRDERGLPQERGARLRADLPGALDRGELFLLYQPQVEGATGRVVAAEALLRWRHPVFGVVGPQEFIPLCEVSGLIQAVGAWVVRHACEQAARWQREFGTGLRMSVNVSAPQLEFGDFPALLAAQLAVHALAPDAVEIELTEGLLLRPGTAATVAQLKAIGARIAVDDFGTGYSALAYLKRFAIDHVKIDRSFVAGLPADPADAAIVRAIVGMGKNLGLALVAEGVETEAQAGFLRALDCEYLQGWLYGRPMAAAEFAAGCLAGGQGHRLGR